LGVRQRAVIVLTYWADLEPAAIADWLGVSEGSVRSHLARARANLREVLDAD
jgi:RNA polymerase sigma factor (sigma-70 family)